MRFILGHFVSWCFIPNFVPKLLMKTMNNVSADFPFTFTAQHIVCHLCIYSPGNIKADLCCHMHREYWRKQHRLCFLQLPHSTHLHHPHIWTVSSRELKPDTALPILYRHQSPNHAGQVHQNKMKQISILCSLITFQMLSRLGEHH